MFKLFGKKKIKASEVNFEDITNQLLLKSVQLSAQIKVQENEYKLAK